MCLKIKYADMSKFVKNPGIDKVFLFGKKTGRKWMNGWIIADFLWINV